MPDFKGGTGNETIFFANPPALNELCAVTLSILKAGLNVGLSNKYQPQIIRCRELIFTEPDIIATPALNYERKVHIIMQQSLFKTGRLQSRFQKMGLQADKPYRVSPVLYQSCLQYTLLAKLAPSWNKVGDYLIQDRNFLICGQKMNAVNLELSVSPGEMFFSIRPDVIKLPPIQLADLEISPPVVHEFLEMPELTIQEYSIERKWCYVLPSMKRGKIINVLHRLPSDCPFKSYRDLKRHWKNTYGYRLPETEEDVIYYQVYFRPIGETLFTYPSCCIRSRDMMVFPRTDPKQITRAFLTDVLAKLPSVCGQKLSLLPNAQYTTGGLLEAAQTELPAHANLTKQAPVHRPYRQSNTPVSLSLDGKASNEAYNVKPHQMYTSSDAKATDQPYTGASQQLGTPSSGKTMNQSHRDTAQATYTPSSGGISNQSCNNSYQRMGTSSRDRPANFSNIGMGMGMRGLPGSNGFNTPLPDELTVPQDAARKIVPCFKPKGKKLIFTPRPTSIAPSNQKTIPVFKKKVQNAQATTSVNKAELSRDGCFGNKEVQQGSVSGLPHLDKAPLSLPNLIIKHAGNKAFAIAEMNHQISNAPTTKLVHQTTMPTSASCAMTKTPLPAFGHKARVREQPSTKGSSLSLGSQLSKVSTTPGKRKLQDENATKPKKPRAKPKIQEGIDMNQLANANQLDKVNSATLISWLRSKGVPCKGKEKKGDLQAKVMMVLQLAGHEQ